MNELTVTTSNGRSLTDYFAGRELPKVNPPASVAGNREFGIE